MLAALPRLENPVDFYEVTGDLGYCNPYLHGGSRGVQGRLEDGIMKVKGVRSPCQLGRAQGAQRAGVREGDISLHSSLSLIGTLEKTAADFPQQKPNPAAEGYEREHPVYSCSRGSGCVS